jgi:8-amino-7-oxononanoate synthase
MHSIYRAPPGNEGDPLSPSSPYSVFLNNLQQLDAQHRRRTLSSRSGIDFTSNDYLALASSPRLTKAVRNAIDTGTPIGAGGSRLLRGNTQEHQRLETQAAEFFGAESSLYFSTGYAANFALLSTLPQHDDLLLLDQHAHASLREGARACRALPEYFPHNDIDALAARIKRWRTTGGKGNLWIAIESLYSMDGDKAPLDDLLALAIAHDAFLVIDEAHATGVFGPHGQGLTHAITHYPNLITVHTCGKALGAAGALLCAPRILTDFLINRAKPFIYSTAPSPLMAVAVAESLIILREEPERRHQLHARIAFANEAARRVHLPSTGTQILPVILRTDQAALAAAAALRANGFDVRAIRPPTVPEGTARLRISISLHVDAPTIERLFDTLTQVLAH